MQASAIPPATPAIWQFYIEYQENSDFDVLACGNTIHAAREQDVEYLGEKSGLRFSRQVIRGEKRLFMEVLEPENSLALAKLIEGLHELYGIDLFSSALISNQHRYFFHVRKLREFTNDQLTNAKYLELQATKYQIGHHAGATPEELETETYAVENDSCQKSKVDFGFISPFPALGVSESLKGRLEEFGLRGLHFEPIVVRKQSGVPRKPLWKLTSSVVLPRSKTKFITKFGNDKEPYDDWSDKWECAYFYDCGYEPPVLAYASEDIASAEPFDIAVTAEKTGNGPGIAFRRIIVSQRFRKIMTNLKVKGCPTYTPVKIWGDTL